MNKLKKVLSIMLCIFMVFSNVTISNAEEAAETKQYDIYPIVREISYDGNEFVMDSKVNIVYEEGIDKATKAYLEEVLSENGMTFETVSKAVSGESNLLLGINGSKGEADNYEDSAITLTTENLYDQYDAYVLEAKDKNITIVGKDSDAVYRGIATLKMMFSSLEGRKLLGAKIEDYAGIEYRGFIEGFYGGWDYETRESLMKFARDVKMNMYVYASKTDDYHTNKWNELYPENEIAEIEKLVKIGEETKCYYVWSVHLGSFFKTTDENGKETYFSIAGDPEKYESCYKSLIQKFTQLYKAGVRKFDILNDDFGGGSYADVVTLLNRINDEFIVPNGCDPITYCPQGYNKAWSGTGTELEALKGLDDSIILYWTGDDVNSPITQSTVDYVAEKTGQPVCFWLNYPVNEHAKSGIFLGNIDHYARDGVTGLKAAVSNPSRFGQSNKAALFQLAALFWNNSNYSEHSDKIWNGAFDHLEPEVTEEYRTIARNTSNCPNSGRVSAGFPESEYIKENLENVMTKVAAGEAIKGTEDVTVLAAEFTNILDAVEKFKNNCTNTALISELTPWLNSLTDVTTACKDILNSLIALEDGKTSDAWSEFAAASKALQGWNTYPSFTGSENMALAGSKRLQPFAAKMISYVKNTLTPVFDENYSTRNLYAVLGGQEQSYDDNSAKMLDGNEATYAQWDVNQKQNDYFGVDLGKVTHVTDISIVQAESDTHHDYFHKAVLEYSKDGKNFTQLGEQYNDTYRITLEGLNIQARYVRLRLVETGTATKADYWTHVREFTVNKEVEERNRIYTNVETYKKQPLTVTGKEYSVSDLNSVTLQSGEYLGMKFTDLSSVSSMVKDGTNLDGLTLEISENGSQWTSVTNLDQAKVLKYVRLINKTDAAVSFNLAKLGVTVENVKANISLEETNLNLKEGSWENVFDGELATYAWTNRGQQAGDYIIFDLGSMIAVHDVTIAAYDGNPRLYNAQIQISADKSNWTTIATVENDNSVQVVPYRYVYADGNGENARYLRIYITGSTGYYLRLHEISVNASVESNADTEILKASFGNNVNSVVDSDLSTLFTGTASSGASLEYKFTEATKYESISILQAPENISNAVVKVLKDDGYETIGTLDESAKKFTLDQNENVYGLKLEFKEGTEVAIYEIYLNGAVKDPSEIGEYIDPIIIEETQEPIYQNIAIGKTIAVSGTSDGNKDNVNDGDTSTKWDSDHIKGNNAKENSWISIDLGGDKTSIFDGMSIHYFNKIYPTAMKIQISNDGTNWITVNELTREHNGATHPVVTQEYEPALTARYVRLFFEELNSAAAGNGVGVTEWEITGVALSKMTVKAVETFETVETELNASAEELISKDFVKVTLNHETAGDYEVTVPVTWDISGYDASKAGDYTIKGILNLPESVLNEENLQPVLEVKVKAAEETKEPVDRVFSDVPEGEWYVEAVQYVYDNGLMSGFKGEFTPQANMTRAMVVTTLYRMENSPEVKDYNKYQEFEDMKTTDWYAEAVAWALNEEIATGDPVNHQFNPNANVTREQLAAFLYRYTAFKDGSVEASGDLSSMKNADKVSSWALKEMKWAVGEKLISGIAEVNAEGTITGYDLAPQGNATRAQMATILQRYAQMK